jgi:hypothetical protein
MRVSLSSASQTLSLGIAQPNPPIYGEIQGKCQVLRVRSRATRERCALPLPDLVSNTSAILYSLVRSLTISMLSKIELERVCKMSGDRSGTIKPANLSIMGVGNCLTTTSRLNALKVMPF